MDDPNKASNMIEFEKAKEGTHVLEISGSKSSRFKKDIMRGIQLAKLLPLLKSAPIKRLNFELGLIDDEGDYSGAYFPQIRKVVINQKREPESYGQTFIAGQVQAVSFAGKDLKAAMQRTFIHELGHHMLNVVPAKTRLEMENLLRASSKHSKPISERAKASWSEYFCETHAACVYHKQSLLKYDLLGYNTVVKVRFLLGLEDL